MTYDNLAIGSDIVEIARIDRMISKFGDAFLTKIFSQEEIAYCRKKLNSAQFFSVRFAAKEAFSKALGCGIGRRIGWQDVRIEKKLSGEPFMVLSSKGAAAMSVAGFTKIKLTLSHTKTLAQAIVVLM